MQKIVHIHTCVTKQTQKNTEAYFEKHGKNKMKTLHSS